MYMNPFDMLGKWGIFHKGVYFTTKHNILDPTSQVASACDVDIVVGHLQYIDHHLYVLCTYFRTCAYVSIDFALFWNNCQETSRKKETCICLHNIHSKNNNIKWQQWRDGCTFLPGTLPILIGCLLCYPNIHLRESGECRKPRKSLLIQVNVEKFINFQLFETNCIDFKTCIPIIYRFKVFLNFQFRFPPMAMIFPSLFSVYSHIKGPIRALQVKLATTDLEWVLSRLTWIVIQ
jgi:hypothetical protein